MKTFEQFKAWLKDMHRYEFFESIMEELDVDLQDFYATYGEKSFLVAAKQIVCEKDYDECRKLDIMYKAFVHGYPVYTLGTKKTVIASLYKSDGVTSAVVHEFMDLYPGAEFEEDCYAVYAYKLEKILQKIG